MNGTGHARSLLVLAALAVSVAAVAVIAAQFTPGDWYRALQKPAWTPPGWVFAPVWTVLYVAIAVAGWLIFTRLGTALGKGLWVAQLVLNGLWSWLFFGLERPVLALVDISVLLVCIVALLVHLAPRARLGFALLLPYGLWVAYALTLNAGIVALNP